MSPRRKGWDWWSEAKLQVLNDYLHGFTRAVRGRSSEAICLDLFAGSFENDRRHGTGTFPGSSQIALNAQPEFTRLALFELAGPAARLRADIASARPGDERWRVFDGDCNETLPSALSWLDPVRWAPTFAFLDPAVCGRVEHRRGARQLETRQEDQSRAVDPDAGAGACPCARSSWREGPTKRGPS